MNYLIKAVLLIGLELASSTGSAQVCPASIAIVEKVYENTPGWASRSMTKVRALSGMDVVEGKLNYDDESANAILRPIDEPNGDYAYKFNGPIGAAEVWIRCNYSDTSIRLDRRIDENVKECRARKVTSKKRSEKPFITAACK